MTNIQNIAAGNSHYIDFNIVYSDTWHDEAKRGDPVEVEDIEALTFMIKRKLNLDDETAEVTKNIESIGTDVTTGKVRVFLHADDTADINGRFFASLRLYMSDDTVQDFLQNDLPYILVDIVQGAVESTD